MISLKIGGIIVAAFIAGAFVASPELRAYAANTVFSTDIVDGEVKTPDIATSAVTNPKIAPNAVSTTKIGTGAVTNSDILGDAVTTGKIRDGQVMAADIATDAVGASEIAGVSKLIFLDCLLDHSINPTQSQEFVVRNICGGVPIEVDDNVVVTKGPGDQCFIIVEAYVQDFGPEGIQLMLEVKNDCDVERTLGDTRISAIVYDTS